MPLKFYNNVHSYSQLILLPWGFTSDQPDNIESLTRVAEAGNDALYAVHGSRYKVGNCCCVLHVLYAMLQVGCIPCLAYPVGGSSIDWTMGELGIPYSYGMELRDTGAYGFLLPPEQIIPTGEEVFAFHLTAAREIIKEFVP